MHSSLLSGHKRQFEECERIFGNQQFYSIEELSNEDLLYDNHPLPGNENGSLNLGRLDKIITFHIESCKDPCNHDNTTDDNESTAIMPISS